MSFSITLQIPVCSCSCKRYYKKIKDRKCGLLFFSPARLQRERQRMSPDGPGGPSLRVQEGALYFAKMSGAPIIPVCYTTSRAWFQKRWDRYLVACPFSKIICNIGNPIFVPRKASADEFEKIRKNLEDFMVAQMRELDAEYNYPEVEQDLTASEFKKKLREEKKSKKSK